MSHAVSIATPSTTACPSIECDTSIISEGDRLSVRLADGVATVHNLTTGGVIDGAPMPDIMLRILERGGLVEFLAAHGGWEG